MLEGIATTDTLGDEPIESSGDLTSRSTHNISSSDAGYITTDDTTDNSMNLETEYMTAYVNPHMNAVKLSGSTGEPIPNHVPSMNQTVVGDEQHECVDFPADEVASSGTITVVVPHIDAVGGDLKRRSMGTLLSGENSGYITAQCTVESAT